MIARLRRTDELAVTLACFGVAGASLALGMWIAGRPLTALSSAMPVPVSVSVSCSAGADCAAADMLPDLQEVQQ